LLHLSRDRDGRPRLLTTNFDTLFERAAHAGGLTDVPSHATKALPKPGGPEDYGIMHLHGRIRDDHLSLPPSDLVLTSADFGDAYLRDGWASQYIEDRMRLNTLVLVGYRAEDAALRLLLETLDADRDRFRDLQNIYAIEKRSDGSASIWKAKGIKPIEFAEYDAIYASLAEWARYALKPAEYGRDRIRAILVDPPTGLKGEE
jgi:SIR2-like domain